MMFLKVRNFRDNKLERDRQRARQRERKGDKQTVILLHLTLFRLVIVITKL